MIRAAWAIVMVAMLAATAAGKDAATQPSTQPDRPAAMIGLDELAPPVARPEHKPPGTLPAAARDLLAQAQDRLKSGDPSGAVNRLERAVGYAPADAQLRRELAAAYLKLSDPGKARRNLLRALDAAPDDLAAHVMLAQILADSGDVDEAILHLRTALKCPDAEGSDPQAATALLKLAPLLARQGYYTAADQCYQQLADRLNQHGSAYGQHGELMSLLMAPETILIERGKCRMQMGQFVKAADLFRRAYARNRSDAAAAQLMIDAMIRARQFDKAEDVIVSMLREPGQRRQVTGMVERLCAAAGDGEMIGRIWKAYEQANAADTGIALALATAADRQGAHDQAARIARALLKRSPGNAAALKILLRAMAALKQTDQILPALAEMVVTDPHAAAAVSDATAELATLKLDPELDRAWARAAMADRSPKKAAMHLVAGEMAVAMNRRLLAIDQFRRAIDADKSFLAAYQALVDAYLAEKDFDKAQRLIERIETVAGDGAFYQRARARVLRAKGDDEEALSALLNALQAEPDHAETLVAVAEAYAATGRQRESQRYLMRALSADPDNVALYRKLFDILMESRSEAVRVRAKGIVQALLRRQPGNVTGRLMSIEYDLARTPQDSPRRQTVLAELAQLRKDAPDNVDVALVELQVRMGGGDQPLPEETFNRIAAQLGEVLGLQPRNVQARRMLGNLMLRQKKIDDAMAIWQQLFRDRPDDRRIGEQFVRTAVEAEKYDLARAALEEMVIRHPQMLWARTALVRVLLEMKDYDQAARTASRFLNQATTKEEKEFYRLSLLQVYKQTEDFARAHKVLDDWQAAGAEGFRLRVIRQSRVELYCRQKQFDRAITAARLWMENSDEPDTVRATLILTLNDHEAFPQSLTLLDRWLSEGSLQSPALFKSLKVLTCGRAKDYDTAIAFVRKWIEEDPWLLRPRELLASVLLQDKRYDQALTILQKSLADLAKITPGSGPTQPTPTERRKVIRWHQRTIIRILALQNLYPKAIEQGREYLKIDPGHTQLMSIVASCYEEIGQAVKAMDMLEAALKIEPDDPTLNNNLGYMLANRGLKLARAEQLIRRALAMTEEPGSAVAYLDSLAWVIYKQGRIAESARVMQTALGRIQSEEIDHPVIRDHAGDIFYRQGNSAAARTQWEKALQSAQKETPPLDSELRAILKTVPAKLDALKADKPVQVAPLGKEVTPATAPALPASAPAGGTQGDKKIIFPELEGP